MARSRCWFSAETCACGLCVLGQPAATHYLSARSPTKPVLQPGRGTSSVAISGSSRHESQSRVPRTRASSEGFSPFHLSYRHQRRSTNCAPETFFKAKPKSRAMSLLWINIRQKNLASLSCLAATPPAWPLPGLRRWHRQHGRARRTAVFRERPVEFHRSPGGSAPAASPWSGPQRRRRRLFP